jgi:hypothetical protein
MQDTLSEFSPGQIGQLLEYLRFEQQKRREMRTEISGTLSDLLQAQLDAQTVYSGKDGKELLAGLPDLLDGTVASELERCRDLSVVLITNIFQQAQTAGVALELNTPDLDNETLTDEANALCGQILARGDHYSHAQPAAPAPGAAPPQEDEIGRLRAENERMRRQLSTNKREWPEFKALVQQLKDKNAEVHRLREQLGK